MTGPLSGVVEGNVSQNKPPLVRKPSSLESGSSGVAGNIKLNPRLWGKTKTKDKYREPIEDTNKEEESEATSMTRFMRKIERSIAHLHEDFTEVDKRLVENVYFYTYVLSKPGKKFIDRNVFDADMVQTFGITNRTMLDWIYERIKTELKSELTHEQYARCILTLMSDHLHRKTDFAFQIYDINRDGIVGRLEYRTYLWNAVPAELADGMTSEEVYKELEELVIDVVDPNREFQGEMNLMAFRNVVQKDELMLEFLGPLFPTKATISAFKALLDPGKYTTSDIMMVYRERRVQLLESASFEPQEILLGLYKPIHITFPPLHE